MSHNAMFDLKMAIAITAIMAIFGHFGHYGHGHFQYKHDIDWYPLKEHSKTKSSVKRSLQKDLQTKSYDYFCDATLKSDLFTL